MAFMLPLLSLAGGAAGAGAAGSGLALAAAGIGAVGSLYAGAAEASQAKYEGRVAGMNAAIERENAARARLEGSSAEEAQRRAARKSLGATAAALAQSGTGVGGSGQDIIRQAATEAELDALNIRYSAETEAGGRLTQAAVFDADRRNANKRARAAMVGGVLKAGGQLLSGVSDYRSARAQVSASSPVMGRPSSSRSWIGPR